MNDESRVESSVPYAERTAWFHEARFGMFVHYGLYSIPGRGEWLMFNERMPAAEYAAFADAFDPRPDAVEQWVALAADVGMRYAVLTARHHDGFCLFDSAHSDFTLSKKRGGRDLVREFTEACRRHGLRVGIYYSLLDWRFPGYFDPDAHPASAEALVAQTHDQVRELMTNYGQIDVLWYDGDWVSHGRVRRDPTEFWRSAELNRMVYDLQPRILINNRSGLQLDLDTPEQEIKASGEGRAWETCMTIGDSCGWGWLRHSPNRKTVPTLLQNLVNCAAGGGNFLINIGPRADGSVDEEDGTRLREMGSWMRTHGEAIYGSARCSLYDQRNPGAPLGLWTRKGSTAYLHVFRWPGPRCTVPLVDGEVVRASLMTTGEALRTHRESNGRLVIEGLPESPPHPHVNVIEVEFADVPRQRGETDMAAWIDGGS